MGDTWGASRTANGTYTEVLTCVTNTEFRFYNQTATTELSIDNVKVQEAGVSGFVTKLYDQTGNNCHATSDTAAQQCKLVAGGDLITSGGKPAWEYTTGGTNKNLDIQGMVDITDLDAWFVQEFDTSKDRYVYPAGTGSAHYGFEAFDGSTSSDIDGVYGSAAYERNGSLLTPTRDELHALQDERCLVYHRSGTTASWGKVTMGHYNSDVASAWNIDKAKFSEWIWYDSDQHGNQAGIESNINTHYSIY